MSQTADEQARQRQRAALARLERFSYWTDSSIGIPFTRIRLGWSPLIGLVPVIGDFAGLILSLYVWVEARRVGANACIQWLMIRNMLIEFVGGLVPVVGDAFDILYKANTRNTELLRGWLEEQLEVEPKRQRFPWFTLILLSVLLALVLAGGWILLGLLLLVF